MVVSSSLYYSYFTPTTVDVCTGGSGYTYTFKICDVLNPVVSDVRTGVTCNSGLVDTWFNIASDFTMLGAPGVQQAGTRSSTVNGVVVSSPATATYLGTFGLSSTGVLTFSTLPSSFAAGAGIFDASIRHIVDSKSWIVVCDDTAYVQMSVSIHDGT